MSATVSGGKKAAAKNLAKDPLFYVKIGARGGAAGKGRQKGFAVSHDMAVLAGAKAGKLSKRGRRYVKTEGGYNYYVNLKSGATEKYKK